MRLFDLEPHVPASVAGPINRAAYAAEQELISRLLLMGCHVAVPVVDDDGVDLIVDYRIKVQVKTTAQRNSSGALVLRMANRRASERKRENRGWLRDHVDVLAVKAIDSGAWWFIPADAARGRSGSFSLHERGGRGLSCWHEAWHLFMGGAVDDRERGTATPRPSFRTDS
jgi:hypothetical protein